MHDKKCNPCHKNTAYYRVHTVAYQWYERLLVYPIFIQLFHIKRSKTSMQMHISQTSYTSSFGIRDMSQKYDRLYMRIIQTLSYRLL